MIGIIAQEVEKARPEYIIMDHAPSNITFVQPGQEKEQQEMLRIGPDGFYVRGKKIPVDENEGQAVFKALKRFLVESELRRNF